jgi:hypothetical protein
MKVSTHAGGVTFAIDDVTPAAKPLKTIKPQESVTLLAEGAVEACSDYTADCVRDVWFHPVLAAACLAHADHRPLILSPDMIWVTILQGFAQHVRNDPERFRQRFVSHPGKAVIEVRRDDFARGSPENPWAEVIGEFSAGVRRHIGDQYDRLVSDFSTTGPVERTACEVTLLDTFQSFFEYRFSAVCGIPEVTLEGTPDDWRKLRAKVEHLAPFDLDWWLPSVRRVCDQFTRASSGDIDRGHWRNLWKQYLRYGGSDVNGWLVKLVPYVRNWQTRNLTVRNPLLADDEQRVSTDALPSGVSKAEFLCTWGRDEPRPYEMLGGFLGVGQDQRTLALRPKMGWAIRPAPEQARLDAELAARGGRPALPPVEFDRLMGERQKVGVLSEFPGDFGAYLKACDGADLFPGPDGRPTYRFRGLAELEPVPSPFPKRREVFRDGSSSEYDTRGPFVRVCDLADGRFAAFEMRPTGEWDGNVRHEYWAVILLDPSDPSPAPPVVAWSFAEFVRRALESRGRLDVWTDRSAEHTVR